MNNNFKALIVEENNGSFDKQIKTKNIAELPTGDVLIKVLYSSLNYKDALSASGNKGITKTYPHTPGIDAAGIVAESQSPLFKPGDEVLCIGYDLGMNTAGGFGQYVRVPASWVFPPPPELDMRTAMIIGTAGFTAFTGIMEIINSGIKTNNGKVLVSGATGGVGIMAVKMLTSIGYNVIATSGKPKYYPLLEAAGAKEIHGRELLAEPNPKPMASQKWTAAIDTVGGSVLTNILKSTAMYGTVATCGNIVGTDFHSSIFPFILRGVRLIGLASAETPLERKRNIWKEIGTKFKDVNFELLAKEVPLEGLPTEIDKMLAGQSAGRVVVNLQ